MLFKVGDIVKRVRGGSNTGNGVADYKYYKMIEGNEDEIVAITRDGTELSLRHYGSGHSSGNFDKSSGEWDR